MKSWPKVKLGEVIICPYLGLSTLIGPTIYHFNPYLALLIYVFQYLSLFTHIYPHLALFTLIWLYLLLIALIWTLQVRKVQSSWGYLRLYYMTSIMCF